MTKFNSNEDWHDFCEGLIKEFYSIRKCHAITERIGDNKIVVQEGSFWISVDRRDDCILVIDFDPGLSSSGIVKVLRRVDTGDLNSRDSITKEFIRVCLEVFE